MKKLKDILKEKEESGDNGEMEKDAKLSALKELRGIASKAMGDGLKGKMDGMQKVTVASDDKAGLVKGLDKAKELMKKSPLLDDEGVEETPEEEAIEEGEESPEDEMSELKSEDMSGSEIDAMIKLLQEKKAKLSK
jgi:hypothetical protein